MAEVLERPKFPTRHRLDVGAYYKMAEAGIIEWGTHNELIDGAIIDLPRISPPHASITSRFSRLFARTIADDLVLAGIHNPVRLDSFNEPAPDLVLLKPRPDSYKASHPSADDVLLLVEVSDSSLAYDRGVRLPLYARFGVPEVWIVDISGGAIEVFREPRDGTYSWSEQRTEGTLTPALVPAVTIDVAALVA